MARLELVCNLLAPSMLPLIVKCFRSQTEWILLLTGLTTLLWVIEIQCARTISRENPELQLPKKSSNGLVATNVSETQKLGFNRLPQKLHAMLCQEPALRLKQYFSVQIWPASISVSLLQLTVLAYSSTLITYLYDIGFSLLSVTFAQASGSIVSLTSTVITPFAVKLLRRRHARATLSGDEVTGEDHGEGKIARTVGLWGIASQLICLVRALSP